MVRLAFHSSLVNKLSIFSFKIKFVIGKKVYLLKGNYQMKDKEAFAVYNC